MKPMKALNTKGAMAVPKAKTVAYYMPAKTSFSATQAI
jgi:hypothetical protein